MYVHHILSFFFFFHITSLFMYSQNKRH
jgi:hypothetical protein